MAKLPTPLRILRRFCPDDLVEALEGDLLEKYENDQRKESTGKAKLNMWWNVSRLFHPAILTRNKFRGSTFNAALLLNYLRVGRRNFLKDPFYSLANILGLSLAFTFAFLSLLYIQHETSFDKFHTNKSNIYRLAHKISNRASGEIKNQNAVTAVPLAKDLAAAVPSITQFSRLASSSATVTVDEENVFGAGTFCR